MRYFEDIPLHEARISRAFEVEEAEAIAFARAWDPQPIHIDKEAAAKTPLGLIVSGIYTVAITFRLSSELTAEPLAVVAGMGWDEIRFHSPVRPGDQVRVRTQAIEKRLSSSRPGFGIMISKLELLNQHDQVVLSLKNSALLHCQPPAATPSP